MTFRPEPYARFSEHRLRAARELLHRVEHPAPARIHDIGCGRGEMARLMADRWPGAYVLGSDVSAEMLEAAAAEPSRVEWLPIDISTWEPDDPFDILYANAVFHWVPDHGALLPRLMGYLGAGGVLAFQVPLTWPEPINAVARELVADRPEVLAQLHSELPSAEWYYDLLAPLTVSVDLWETRYLQVLWGDDPVADWAQGAALRPIIDGLEGRDLEAFLDRYRRRMREAYPRRDDGSTLLSFPRLFVVARR